MLSPLAETVEHHILWRPSSGDGDRSRSKSLQPSASLVRWRSVSPNRS